MPNTFRLVHALRGETRLVLMLAWLCGCGGQGFTSGTSGQVTFDGTKLPDLQISVYAPSGDCVATGVTDRWGRFELKHPETVEPVSLFSGTFQLVVESVAAAPIPVAAKYTKLATTPLTRAWSAGEGELHVEVHSK